MPKLARAKIGVILIRELEPRKWRASWVDPVTRKHIRRLLPAATFQDAEKAAREINALWDWFSAELQLTTSAIVHKVYVT